MCGFVAIRNNPMDIFLCTCSGGDHMGPGDWRYLIFFTDMVGMEKTGLDENCSVDC